MLDLGSVTRRVGEETVLFHGDLQGDTGCEQGTGAIPSSWRLAGNGVWESSLGSDPAFAWSLPSVPPWDYICSSHS